jgi:monoterpene epsilon-lactone hydrolase
VVSEAWIEDSPVGTVVRPPVPTGPTVLYLHGDRYLECPQDGALDVAGHLSQRTGARVVCARYRSEFPAALEDVGTAFDYCRGLGEKVVVAGDRLGGGLAVALLVRLRDSGAESAACATLDSPLLDLSLRSSSLDFNAFADPTFDIAELRRRVERYAAGTPRTDPIASPLHANLHGLPPIQLRVAGTDPLLDDSLALAARAARSGVAVDLRVHPDAGEHRRRHLPAMAAFIRARRGRRPCSMAG